MRKRLYTTSLDCTFIAKKNGKKYGIGRPRSTKTKYLIADFKRFFDIDVTRKDITLKCEKRRR